jgi:hypothetical protein
MLRAGSYPDRAKARAPSSSALPELVAINEMRLVALELRPFERVINLCCGRQGKKEGCAFVSFGFGPDSAAVSLNDALGNCEANAVAFEFFI